MDERRVATDPAGYCLARGFGANLGPGNVKVREDVPPDRRTAAPRASRRTVPSAITRSAAMTC